MLDIQLLEHDNKVISAWRDFKDKQGNVLASFLIAGIQRPSFQKGIDLLNARIERELQGLIPVNDDSKLRRELLLINAAENLILDWKGIELEGKEFKYSAENAITLLTKTKLGVELWLWIDAEAKQIQESAFKQVDDLAGKSSSSMSTVAANTKVTKRKPSMKNYIWKYPNHPNIATLPSTFCKPSGC